MSKDLSGEQLRYKPSSNYSQNIMLPRHQCFCSFFVQRDLKLHLSQVVQLINFIAFSNTTSRTYFPSFFQPKSKLNKIFCLEQIFQDKYKVSELLVGYSTQKIVSYSYRGTIRRSSPLSSMTWFLLQLRKYTVYFFLYQKKIKNSFQFFHLHFVFACQRGHCSGGTLLFLSSFQCHCYTTYGNCT